MLHFNENGKRLQAENSRGEKIFAVSFSRGGAPDGVAKAVKVPQTFGKLIIFCKLTEWIERLLHRSVDSRFDSESGQANDLQIYVYLVAQTSKFV